MSGSLTMSRVAETLKGLMDHWEEALQVTIKTGYWNDTIACDRIIQEYGKSIEEALTSGKFSGDSAKALEYWRHLTGVEAEFRASQTEIVRKGIPAPDPNLWWVVLDCHPHAKPDDVKNAFREKMKACHPDRVAGLAPEIRKLANDMAQKLTTAMRQYEQAG